VIATGRFSQADELLLLCEEKLSRCQPDTVARGCDEVKDKPENRPLAGPRRRYGEAAAGSSTT